MFNFCIFPNVMRPEEINDVCIQMKQKELNLGEYKVMSSKEHTTHDGYLQRDRLILIYLRSYLDLSPDYACIHT